MALHEDGDPCLFVCPGTHQRMRTEEERQALCFEWETDGKDGKAPRYRWHLGCIPLEMPAISLLTGQPVKQLPTEVQLKLKRGQAAVVHRRPLAHDASLARLRFSHRRRCLCVSGPGA